MKGKAISYGAISILNAIPMGKGSSLSINLNSEVEIELTNENTDVTVFSNDEKINDVKLINQIISDLFQIYKIDDMGAKIVINSDIPIGQGLKSSSSISNAVTLATLEALKKKMDDLSVIKLGVNSSLKSGVSITGAFDDACACFYGGLIVTDNYSQIILKQASFENLQVIIHVPNEKIYTNSVDKLKLEQYSNLSNEVFNLILKEQYFDAMTLNGFIISTSLNLSSKIALSAINVGALSAGISGTGPATAALCYKDNVDDIYSEWDKLPGKIIKSTVNNNKCGVITY